MMLCLDMLMYYLNENEVKVANLKMIQDPAPNLQPIGCYNDSAKERALPVFYANARGNIDWFNMELTVNQCAQVASDMGYEYFAVQFYGECYSGRNAKESYAKYGNITEGCWEFDNQTGFAVGKEGANFVYQIRNFIKNKDAQLALLTTLGIT
ncbi:unnamed protein product [Porites evermanni]|uniref:WSC domain-containing protein n=1 Tax=Porites evermanni TaxID=104178 RepID=A0ABN8RPX3_9CNID|nr:unnamed protein product [Porites evermanni]